MFIIHWRLQGMKIFYHEQISHENIQRGIFSKLRYDSFLHFCEGYVICQTKQLGAIKRVLASKVESSVYLIRTRTDIKLRPSRSEYYP